MPRPGTVPSPYQVLGTVGIGQQLHGILATQSQSWAPGAGGIIYHLCSTRTPEWGRAQENRQKNQPRGAHRRELGTGNFIEHPGTSVLTQQRGRGPGRWWETAEQAGDSHPHFQSLKNCLKMGLSRPWGRISTCSGRKAWLTGCPPVLLRRGTRAAMTKGTRSDTLPAVSPERMFLCG